MLIEDKIRTERFELRIIQPKSDSFRAYLSWVRDVNLNKFIQGVNKNTSLEDLHRYVEEKNQSPNSLLLGIYHRETSKHVGNLKLEPIVFGEVATLGILIGEASWRGLGVGFEVIQRMIEYSFDELKLNRIQLGVDLNNIAAVRLYEKLGFEPENKEQVSSGIMMSLKKY
jgi:[ribosomal protein S5]-alanine N-acetyltransferase